MIFWAIKAAKGSAFKNNVYVTSENNKILNISKNFGAKIIMRPTELSGDKILKLKQLNMQLNVLREKVKKNYL